MTRLNIAKIVGIRKLVESLGYFVASFAWS